MGILQRNPFRFENTKPLYTLGLDKTIVIVGLGNVGKQYEKTRHNIGFVCLDSFAMENEFDKWVEKKDLKCQMSIKNLGNTRVVLVKPATMMNLSGEATQAVAHFYKVDTASILVVHDEADIPFGQIRTKTGGGTAGHNGVRSLVERIGGDFARVRIGIMNEKNPGFDMADYVLANFTKDEQAKMPELTKEVNSILTEFVYSGQLNPETRNFNS